MGRKRKNRDENTLVLLVELSGSYWQIGAVTSILFCVFGLMALSWVFDEKANAAASPYLAGFAQSIGPMLYVVPVALFFIAGIAGVRSLIALSRNR